MKVTYLLESFRSIDSSGARSLIAFLMSDDTVNSKILNIDSGDVGKWEHYTKTTYTSHLDTSRKKGNCPVKFVYRKKGFKEKVRFRTKIAMQALRERGYVLVRRVGYERKDPKVYGVS